jgi:ribonuclease P protein component
MTAAADFQFVLRRGTRSGRKTVVVSVAQTGNAKSMAGFAVSRAVGGAVVRNRVKRRLRAIMASHLPLLPAGSAVVVRALPPAASAEFQQLRVDVASALNAAQAKAFA